MKYKNTPGIFITEDKQDVYPIKELKNEEFSFYHLNLVSKEIFACKIIKMTIQHPLNIHTMTIQFMSGGKFCIVKDIDKKMFFKLNKEKFKNVGLEKFNNPVEEGFKIYIMDNRI
tara:strand:+ start:145 stop:489 length:345 start_codon:yes stop_codon:yes gene_type:complete